MEGFRDEATKYKRNRKTHLTQSNQPYLSPKPVNSSLVSATRRGSPSASSGPSSKSTSCKFRNLSSFLNLAQWRNVEGSETKQLISTTRRKTHLTQNRRPTAYMAGRGGVRDEATKYNETENPLNPEPPTEGLHGGAWRGPRRSN